MGRQEQWDKIEQTYLEMKEQELDQVDMSELWSRIDEKLEQNQEGEEPEKKKRYTGIRRKTAILGTLTAAALLVVVSVTVMRTSGFFEENSETNTNSWEQMSDADTNSLGEEDTNKDTTNEFSMKKDAASESETSVEEDAVSPLLYVEKEDGFYEFSVNLEKYRLQLVAISVNKEENMVAIAYSDFSNSAQERLQNEVEDISAYDFYVDSEGVLYMEKENRYYQVHLEEKGDGLDGK